LLFSCFLVALKNALEDALENALENALNDRKFAVDRQDTQRFWDVKQIFFCCFKELEKADDDVLVDYKYHQKHQENKTD